MSRFFAFYKSTYSWLVPRITTITLVFFWWLEFGILIGKSVEVVPLKQNVLLEQFACFCIGCTVLHERSSSLFSVILFLMTNGLSVCGQNTYAFSIDNVQHSWCCRTWDYGWRIRRGWKRQHIGSEYIWNMVAIWTVFVLCASPLKKRLTSGFLFYSALCICH